MSTERFSVVEATVARVHAAFASGETTCVDVVRACLDRIEAYDRKGPALRAILTVNPHALSNSTGYPAVVFPAGFAAPTATAPIGVPVGMEVLGPAWREGRLLAFAYAFEQGVGPRRTPLSTPPLAHP